MRAFLLEVFTVVGILGLLAGAVYVVYRLLTAFDRFKF